MVGFSLMLSSTDVLQSTVCPTIGFACKPVASPRRSRSESPLFDPSTTPKFCHVMLSKYVSSVTSRIFGFWPSTTMARPAYVDLDLVGTTIINSGLVSPEQSRTAMLRAYLGPESASLWQAPNDVVARAATNRADPHRTVVAKRLARADLIDTNCPFAQAGDCRHRSRRPRTRAALAALQLRIGADRKSTERRNRNLPNTSSPQTTPRPCSSRRSL